MSPDSYQQAWQADAARTRVTVDANLLLQEVQRNQRDFQAGVLRRDLFEVGTALLLLPIWIYLGAVFSLPWTWYLGVPAIAWIAAFLLYYRLRNPLKLSEPNEPLAECVRQSLRQVEEQIWLLRNVFWWYLLPPGISILTFFGHVAWLRSEDGLDALGRMEGFFILLAVYGFLYFRNQRAVNKELEPRREELLTLLASLGIEKSFNGTTKNSSHKTACSTELLNWLILTAFGVIAVVLIPLAGQLFEVNYTRSPTSAGYQGDALATIVTNLRQEKNLVGLTAMVTVNGKVQAAAAQGERLKGSGVPLEIGDRWHLGGIAKSVTATMIARLIESGKMDWSDTVGETFTEPSVHEDWRPVTLRQLLTDTAGAPRNFGIGVRRQRPALGPECTRVRREVVLEVMADRPVHTPGEKFMYSNVGYTIAGAMAEKVTGETWENLVKREVFEPLKLTQAGFGPPTSPDKKLPQPRGHHTIQGWKIAVDDKTDNTSIMAPSGMVHMSLRDLCTYAEEHLHGELGKGILLSAETYKLLHTPELNNYACGWIRNQPDQVTPSPLYWHNGSNTMWYALVVFIPRQDMVVAVASNDGDFASAQDVAWEIARGSANGFTFEGGDLSRGEVELREYPKKAPFSAVRWKNSQPEVQVDDQWYKLVSLENLPISEILSFSKATFEDKWQKRFEEDLVELLSRMGYPPQDTVTMVVQSLSSSDTRVLEDVPMTEENRRAIYSAARTRENSKP